MYAAAVTLRCYFSTLPPPPTSTVFPYTTLFRSPCPRGRARRDVAGPPAVLDEDVGDHGRRQDDPGDRRGVRIPSQGRLGRPAAGGGEGRRTAPARRPDAVSRRMHALVPDRRELPRRRSVRPRRSPAAAGTARAVFTGSRRVVDSRLGDQAGGGRSARRWTGSPPAVGHAVVALDPLRRSQPAAP